MVAESREEAVEHALDVMERNKAVLCSSGRICSK